MAAPGYIGPTELGSYGAVGIPTIQLSRASALIDALLHRPEGLTWTPDAAGWPCYQTRMTPRLTLTIPGPIPPGISVVVPLTGNIDTNPDQLIGEVIVLDRLVGVTDFTPGTIVEACVVASATATSITLSQVLFNHPGPVTADFGMVVSETKQMPDGRSVAHLGAWPIARIHSGTGRYGQGRHTAAMGYATQDDYGLIGILRTFGGAPLWQPFPISATSWDPLTAHVWIPAGTWMSYFNEVTLRYCAGWSQQNVPDVIKLAVASIAQAMQSNLMPGNIISYKAGDTQIVKAAATVLDQDVLKSLYTYAAYQFA